MNEGTLRKLLWGYLLLLLPLGWLAMRYDRYAVDGDAVSYMDIADLLHAHRWSAAVNAYWHPLYPALLWAGQVVFHTSRATELRAYYLVNFAIFVLQLGAVWVFVRALVRLRSGWPGAPDALLSQSALQLLATALLVIAVMRELSLGKIRTDSLLQALILLGLAMLMESLAAESVMAAASFAVAMGLSFGLAYLTKSFAFLLALLCIVVLVAFAVLVQRRGWMRSLVPGAAACVVFAAVAGPYVAALSHQKHRFDFGDSGSLNYAWYVSQTEKMHLQPWMTGSFGSATVHLSHPEQQLMRSPGVYSYGSFPYGTYPPWFDATYFNERIVPRFNLRLLLVRDARNAVLIARYILNHPEGPVLLLLFLLMAARFRGRAAFAWPVAGIGLAMWIIYATVNIEERYVTVAYFAVLIPVFAGLRTKAQEGHQQVVDTRLACVCVVLLASLTAGEFLRQGLASRRDEMMTGAVPAWRDAGIYGASEGLAHLGVHAGDTVACIGAGACLYDLYWARLAGVRILTEVYDPGPDHLLDRLDALQNRNEVYRTVQQQGARVLVGVFDAGEMNRTHPAAAGWMRLGETNYYALPLNLR